MRIARKANGRNHWYVDLDTEQRIDGVTSLTKAGLPKPALMKWAGDATAEYAVDNWDGLAKLPPSARLKKIMGGRWEKRDAAADKGTAVHRMAERLIPGNEVIVPDELRGYVTACVAFLNDFDVRQVHVETTVYSETHRHVGTPDLIADVLLPDMPEYDHISRGEDGYSRALLDWKTSKSGIFGEVALQLAPYRFSEYLITADGETVPMPGVDFCAGVHLRPDSTYLLVPLTVGPEEYRDFLYVKEVARIVAGLPDLVGEPILPPTASRYVLTKADS